MGRARAIASDARHRVLETADRLFYEDGVRAVGIDRIIAEANVAKMTLYTHFRSKDELILAVLKHREQVVSEFFRSAMERHGQKTKSPLQAFFAALKEWFESPGFRGCAFQNVAVELADPTHAGTEFVRGHKERFGRFLRGLVEQSIGKAAVKVAPAVTLLVEGAIVTAVIQGKPDAADVARDAALKLVADDVVEKAAAYFQSQGFDVVHASHMTPARGVPHPNLGSDVTPAELYDFVRKHTPANADGVFIAGNGFRALGVIAALEEDLGRPVLTANQVAFWYALRRTDVGARVDDYGQVFRTNPKSK